MKSKGRAACNRACTEAAGAYLAPCRELCDIADQLHQRQAQAGGLHIQQLQNQVAATEDICLHTQSGQTLWGPEVLMEFASSQRLPQSVQEGPLGHPHIVWMLLPRVLASCCLLQQRRQT